VGITVSALATTPVKGTRVERVDEIYLGRDGARGDRRFYVVDDRGRMVNAKALDGFQSVVASCTDAELTLAFADGSGAAGAIVYGSAVATTFFSDPREARLVDGGFSEALTDYFGRPLRLVEAGSAVDRGPDGAASLVSRASLARLSEEAGEPAVDARRFRMLVEIDGVEAHGEDRWVGAEVRIGAALVRFNGHVGRCLVTSQDPETGGVDLPTLDVLRSYRADVESTEPLPFGIYGEVLEPGAVRAGDTVVPPPVRVLRP
jgi:hypothetical protein